MNKAGNYFPELDSLRFFAFLLVLIHHSPYWKSISAWKTIAEYGWMGVDLFLCLSAVMRGDMWLISTVFKNWILGYFGKISYGLYVYHLASIWLAYKITNNFISPERLLVYPLTVLLIALLITLLVSMLSYQALEKPFLRLKERFTFIQSRPI